MTLVAALSTAWSSAAQSIVQPPVVRGSVRTMIIPKVTQEFKDAVTGCLRSRNNSSSVRIPWTDHQECQFPTKSLDSDQTEYLSQEWFVAVTNGAAGNFLLVPRNSIVLNRATVSTLVPSWLSSQKSSTIQRCNDLLPPWTTIVGWGRVVIGSVVTDGYSGSIVNGVKCENR